MSHERTLNGTGTIFDHDGNGYEVDYHISVFNNGRLRHADGFIRGDGMTILKIFDEAKAVQLELSNGERMNLLITHVPFTPGTVEASIKSTGPVP